MSLSDRQRDRLLAAAADAYGAAAKQLEVANVLLREAIGAPPDDTDTCCDAPSLSKPASTPAGTIRVCSTCGATVPADGG